MNIIIPMAGKGNRFVESGFKVIKPLIEVAGMPMYRYAVDCLPLYLATKLIFIVRENEFLEPLIANINQHYSNIYPCVIKILKNDTQGQAETVLHSRKELVLDEPTLVHNCDTYISPTIAWPEILRKKIDGAVVLFSSNEPRWSYAKLDKNQYRILDIREKIVISPYASTGTYYFADTCALMTNIEILIKENQRENNEYYLSTIYRFMIAQQKYIAPLWAEKILCFGTPSDLVDSLNYMLQELKTRGKDD